MLTVAPRGRPRTGSISTSAVSDVDADADADAASVTVSGAPTLTVIWELSARVGEVQTTEPGRPCAAGIKSSTSSVDPASAKRNVNGRGNAARVVCCVCDSASEFKVQPASARIDA